MFEYLTFQRFSTLFWSRVKYCTVDCSWKLALEGKWLYALQFNKIITIRILIFCGNSFIKLSYDHRDRRAFFLFIIFPALLAAEFSSFRNHCAFRSVRYGTMACYCVCVLLNEKRSLWSTSRLGFLPNAQKGALLRRLEKIKAPSALNVYKHKPNKHWTFYLLYKQINTFAQHYCTCMLVMVGETFFLANARFRNDSKNK
jgi:hypothetical protein